MREVQVGTALVETQPGNSLRGLASSLFNRHWRTGVIRTATLLGGRLPLFDTLGDPWGRVVGNAGFVLGVGQSGFGAVAAAVHLARSMMSPVLVRFISEQLMIAVAA